MGLNVELLRASFEKAKPIADKVADTFYGFLFSDYPAAKGFFKNVDMQRQKKALIGSLVFIVNNLENTDELVNYLKKMGQRHFFYGVSDEHYSLVGNTLIKTFAHLFGDEWTNELQQAWVDAYGVIADTMISGVAELDPEEAIIERTKKIARDVIYEVLEEELKSDFKDAVRIKVRRMVFDALQEEAVDFSQRRLKKVA